MPTSPLFRHLLTLAATLALSLWLALPAWADPVFSNMNPTTGPSDGGTAVTITGTGLDAVTKVKFGTIEGTIGSSRTATSLPVTTPSHSAGSVDVTLEWSGTAVSAGKFQFQADGHLSSLTVNKGTLSPSFAEGTFSYDVKDLKSTDTSITVSGTAKAGSSNATVSYKDITTDTTKDLSSGTMDLIVGLNKMKVHVEPVGGTAQDYTLSMKLPPGANTATLTMEYGATSGTIDLAKSTTGTKGAEGKDLSYEVSADPSYGTVTLAGSVATYKLYSYYSSYKGDDSFTYKVTSKDGNTSATAKVTVKVNGGEPDPTLDSNVKGVIQSQVSDTRRLIGVQILNMSNRFAELHLGNRKPVSMGLDISWNDGGAPVQAPNELDKANPEAPVIAPAGDEEMPSGDAIAKLDRELHPRFAIWSRGNITYGQTGDSNKKDFTSFAMTAGFDDQLADWLTAGWAAGYGETRSDSGTDSNTTSDIMNLMAYASLQPVKDSFLDAMIGYGHGNHDVRRYSTQGKTYLDGARTSWQLFGSLQATQEFDMEGFRLAPYLRLDMLYAAFKDYTETGADAWALTYDDMHSSSILLTPGMRASVLLDYDWGSLVPSFTMEYRHALEDGWAQGIGYALGADGSPSWDYEVTGDSTASNVIATSIAIAAMTRNDFNVDLAYEFDSSLSGGAAAAETSHSLRLNLRQQF